MPSYLPQTQRDQVKLIIAVAAVALAAVYYLYPYTSTAATLAADEARIEQLEKANKGAQKEFASGSVDALRTEAAEQRSALLAMRRLVPTGNEVPALLEEVSTAARRAGLDVGAVTPEPMIRGDKFDTYRYQVTIIGGYHEIGAFMANVGSLPRVVAPVSFKLAASNAPRRARRGARSRAASSDRSGLEATVTLQTYVERTTPSATAPRVASAARETNR